VTSTYLFSAEVTHPTKIAFPQFVVDLWAIRYFGKFLCFLMTPKLASKLEPFPMFWVKNMKKSRKNCIFHFQMIKHCCEVFPINNFEWQKFSCIICLEDKCEQALKSMRSLFAHFSMISVHPSIDANTLFLKLLYLHNGGICSHVWHTVERGLQGLTRGNIILRANAQ